MTNYSGDKNILSFLALGIIILMSKVLAANGKPPSRISGGNLAMPGEFKYMVAIMDKKQHICGGAIISERHILTAAHCVEGERRPSVVTGITDLGDPNGQVHNVWEVIMHPDYIPYTPTTHMERDIAVLVLENDLTLDENLEKVALPEFQAGPSHTGIIVGWGYTSSNNEKTSFLHKMMVMLLNDRDCIDKGTFVSPDRLCGYQSYGTICGGDSGSPLVLGRTVIGVASASACLIGYAHIYVNVYHYRNWIQDTMSRT